MFQDISALYALASRPTRRIIGLMSGTSLDGLDVALCEITGAGPETAVVCNAFQTIDYTLTFRNSVRRVFAKRTVDLEDLTLLNAEIGQVHGDLVCRALSDWQVDPASVDLIASHGQTVYHAPTSLHQQAGRPNATLQIGDADHIAVTTGIITLGDFRQKHIAAGGEGAPLAAYGDQLLFSDPYEHRILLNLGGIANLTDLPAASGDRAVPLSSDIGPGNTLMDAVICEAYPDRAFDADAAVARRGTVDRKLLAALMQDPFLAQAFPKTTGPEHFSLNYVRRLQAKTGTGALDLPDLMATLNRFTAESVAAAVHQLGRPSDLAVYLSGGGAHNPLVVDSLSDLLEGAKIGRTSDLGIDPDAKEAVLFAVLANECVARQQVFASDVVPHGPAITMGKVSFPS